MEYKLIKLPTMWVIVSNEQSKEGEYQSLLNGNFIDRKVIAIRPSHKLNEITFDLPESIEDVERIAGEYIKETTGKQMDFMGYREYLGIGFCGGFKKAKEIYKWTDEDIIKAMQYASSFNASQNKIIHYLEELSKPKEYVVELLMEEEISDGWVPSYNNPDNNNLDTPAEPTGNFIPKVTNNKITILKATQI